MAKKGRVEIDGERCKSCYLCIRACPSGVLAAGEALNTSGSYPAVFAAGEKCVACANCYEVCPDTAITVWEVI